MARILVVDDEYLILSAYARVLKASGHEVLSASRASKAQTLLQKNPVDVIVSDIIMPGMNGISFLELLCRHWPEIPVIMITGFPSLSSEQSLRRQGAFAYLSKPVSVPELRATVKDAIADGKRRRNNASPEDALLSTLVSDKKGTPLKVQSRSKPSPQRPSLVKRLKLT